MLRGATTQVLLKRNLATRITWPATPVTSFVPAGMLILRAGVQQKISLITPAACAKQQTRTLQPPSLEYLLLYRSLYPLRLPLASETQKVKCLSLAVLENLGLFNA
jgi:hypothetical protein